MKFCKRCGSQLINDDCPNKMCPYTTRFIEKLYNREFGKDIEEVYDGDNENIKKYEKK
jgi:uncharacterized membrane protein YvbJ